MKKDPASVSRKETKLKFFTLIELLVSSSKQHCIAKF